MQNIKLVRSKSSNPTLIELKNALDKLALDLNTEIVGLKFANVDFNSRIDKQDGEINYCIKK
jgi:hypothetical protein